MKRHGDLFWQISHILNIYRAHDEAKRGKSHYSDVIRVEENKDEMLCELRDSLVNKEFTTSEYRTKQVHEPKERTIYILPYYPDRIVQHAIMNVIQPIWDKIFIYDTYSAVPGKGIHKAIKRLDDFLAKFDGQVYCLQFDVRKYYPSMNHEILMSLIERKIKCPDTLELLRDVVESVPGETNVPIGNYLSQYFGNIYLNEFDHWLKEVKRVQYYIRYNDDGVILHDNKAVLHHLHDAIEWYLEEKLGLSLNPKTRIYPVGKCGIDFLGYRTFRDFRLLRKSSSKKFKNKANFLLDNQDTLPPQHIVSSIMSYVGWLQHGDCYNLMSEHLFQPAMISMVDDACNELEYENPLYNKYPAEVEDAREYHKARKTNA